MDSYLEFHYRPRAKGLLLGIAFFGPCTAVLAQEARTNDRGLIIDGLIEMSTAHATIFYWVLAALSAGFVLISILGLMELMFSPEKPILRLTPTEVIIPPYLFRREARTVLFSEITGLTDQTVQKQRFLTLRYGDRKKASINHSWLPDDAAFQTVLQFITEKVKQNSPR